MATWEASMFQSCSDEEIHELVVVEHTGSAGQFLGERPEDLSVSVAAMTEQEEEQIARAYVTGSVIYNRPAPRWAYLGGR